MSLSRVILTVVVAASLALLPAANAAASSLNPADATAAMDMAGDTAMPADMQMTGDMHDCCPPKAMPGDQSTDRCASMGACPVGCFNLPDTVSYLIAPTARGSALPFLLAQVGQSRAGELPFRPPRV